MKWSVYFSVRNNDVMCNIHFEMNECANQIHQKILHISPMISNNSLLKEILEILFEISELEMLK